MTHARRQLGAAGEERAAEWYHRRGYTIVARNWRCHDGELDLVVARPDVVVFSEVKTRRTDRFGLPAEAVTPFKQRRVRALARQFLRENPQHGRRVRFDVVAILGDEIHVLEAAF